MAETPAVCIIGAGSSGLTAAKALHERGIAFDCWEQGDRAGGLWAFGNSSGLSAAYRSLHVNTSRRPTAYSDFPMPAQYPAYPHHTQMAAYFDAYVDHFGFRHRITFNTAVARATRCVDGRWHVTLSGGEARYYDALIVANGHHWDPQWPQPPVPGHFDGVMLHTHSYVDNRRFLDQNVVVVGGADSAVDIAVEVSFVARTTYLAMRRGAYVIPKYLFGQPVDQWRSSPYLPWRVKQLLRETVLRLAVGRMENFGLPAPAHGLMQAHPTVSSYLLPRVADGGIVVKPNLAALLGDHVRFADGSIVAAEAIIYGTGYKVSFPFFDRDVIAAPANELALFKHVFHPDEPGVFFIGLVQPSGALMPVAEQQAAWVGDYLCGRYALPPRAQMLADMERERVERAHRYVPSQRHTMEVDSEVYLHRLKRERARGAARARREPGRTAFASPVRSPRRDPAGADPR